MPLSSANFWVTKECEAPQSNNNVAGVELTRNIPIMMFGSSWASSVVTWFTRPLPLLGWTWGAGFLGGAPRPCAWLGALGHGASGFLLGHCLEKCPDWP